MKNLNILRSNPNSWNPIYHKLQHPCYSRTEAEEMLKHLETLSGWARHRKSGKEESRATPCLNMSSERQKVLKELQADIWNNAFQQSLQAMADMKPHEGHQCQESGFSQGVLG